MQPLNLLGHDIDLCVVFTLLVDFWGEFCIIAFDVGVVVLTP